MQEFLDYVIRNLIDYPDEMILTKVETAKKTVFMVRLRQSDVGKVIGKHGNTIDAIRSLLGAAASRHGPGHKADLEIVEAPHSTGRPADGKPA